MKQILRKTLLILLGGVMSTAAWAETIASLGNITKGWNTDGSYKSYTVSANKTLTLNFTVSSLRSEGSVSTDGHFINIKQDDSAVMSVQPNGGFWYNAGWWYWDGNESYDRSWNDEVNPVRTWEQVFKEDVINGAIVELTIQRYQTQVTYYADITTTSHGRHYLRIITKENTFDAEQDITVELGADFAVLTGITDVTTDESITGTLIGRGDNHADYDGTNATHQDFTLSANKSLTLNFINYSSKIGWGDNWYVRITNGTKYFDLRCDYWGGESDGAGYYYHSEDTSSPGYFTLTSSTGAYFDGFPTVLHKANVTLTVTRVGKVITISAVQNCTSSVVKTQTYTLTHDDFETGDITVGLYAAWSHLDLLPVTKTMTAAGWATYCSPYALDFTNDIANLTDVYIITGGDGSHVTTTSVKGSTVPANTGLLLKGTAGDINIPIVGTSTTDVSGNKLIGKTESYNLASNGGYVLMASPSVGFYKNTNAFTVGANTAYLPADFAGGAEARSFFSLDDETTGINMVNGEGLKVNGSEVYYDLQGRRVLYPTKGLYIVNGKKVIIK